MIPLLILSPLILLAALGAVWKARPVHAALLLALALALAREQRPFLRALGWFGLVLLAALLNSRGLIPVARADGPLEHLLVKPAGVALWLLIAWLLCLRSEALE